jgi:hypothetical protein
MKRFAVAIVWLSALMSGILPALAQTTPPPTAGAKAPPPAAPRYTGKLATDPARYIEEVQLMMATTNNAAAKSSAAKLKELWGSNRLTATQQGRIVAISQTMLAKKFRPRPHFEALFTALVGGANVAKLSDQQMDQYLDVLSQTLDKEPVTETEKFLTSSSRFLSTGFLYRSGFNSLRSVGGTVSFSYSPVTAPESSFDFGAPTPAPKKEEEIPAAPKPAPKPAAKPAPKPVAKKAAPKKAASSGWDTADLWSSPWGGGWGDDDGWGTPVKKKAPAKPAAKAPAKTAAKPAAATPKADPVVSKADFDSSAGFDSGSGASGGFDTASPYESYYAPPARGAVMVIKDADLFMATAGDSVFIRKVSGSVVPNSNRFIGTSGQLTWNIKGDPVTADFTGFDFDMGKPEFSAQPMTLTYPALLEAPVKGALSYKSTRKKPGAADNGYPRFISLTNNARIKTLGENIKYTGGLTLAGSRMLSAALDMSPSTVTVSMDGKPKFRAASKAYVLGDSLITATRASVVIYEGAKDSITHPGALFKYEKGKKRLKLLREEGMYKNTPYTDSYHQLDINTEMLTWDLQKPEVEFAVLSAKNQQTANFESRDFFTNSRYQQLKSINKFHPLQMLAGYLADHGGGKTANIKQINETTQISEANLATAMAGLARDGYVTWNGQTGDVTMLPKGAHYVASARNKQDYDHIAIKSLSGAGRNATLNLNTNELLVRGVDRFNFSDDSATVFVQPDSGRIRIHQNRNIDFSGLVVASAMRFKGREFKFDYNGFYVDMMKIDSIVIRSPNKKAAKGDTKTADFALTNKGKVSEGRLYINDPKNKSGRKKKPNFPSFDSKSGANVYFGKQDVLGGAYDSTMVFDIPPFKLDSLNGIGKTASGFDGTFRSGGILPDIKTKLTTQPDGSLGFTYDIPKDGFPLYKGRGRATGKVILDAKGLQIDGKVTYGSGTFDSDQFVFYRDSVVAIGKTGNIAAKTGPGVDIPKMTLPNGYAMNWNVRQDSMYLTTPASGEAVKLYENPAAKTAYTFKGTALLTSKGAGGSGRLDGPQSFIKSPDMTFKTDSYSGKQATLAIKSAEANKPALTANNVTFDYDMKKGVSDFHGEEGSKSNIDLPYSQFKTSLSGGRWDFKKKRVELKRASAADSSSAYFYSTNPNQEGLKFKAATGVYDLAKYRLEASGVPYVASADAWIIPDSGRVSVLAKGELKPFKNAKVQLDSLAKFHQLYKGNIKVLSKKAFTGDALYSFKTVRGSYDIKFGGFETDSSAFVDKKGKPVKVDPENPPAVATVGTGVVDGKNPFQLAPRIGYRGDVKLNSQRRGLIFDGQVQLQFGKSRANAEWFAVKDSIDPKNISLTLRDPKAEDGTPLLTGLYVSDVSNKVYPLYVSTLPNSTDFPLFSVDGELRYDDRKGIFTISRHDAYDANIYDGAVLTYSDSTSQLGFRGPMTFIKGSKDYKMVGSGVGTANPDSARYTVDALLGIDISMPGKAIDAMGAELASITKNSPEALDGGTNELYKVGEFIGSKAVEAYTMRKGQAEPLMKLSPKFNHTLLLSKVNLRWSEKNRAWYSVGQLGLAGVGKTPLNALVDGYVEIKRDNAADWVEIYIEAEPQVWYYLKYSNNLLLAKSQNETFDAELGKTKGDYNTATTYGAYLGEFTDVDGFRSHFQREYLGQSGKLAARPAAPPKSDEPGVDAAAGKKKKKGKNDDPFGSGEVTDPNAPPADAPTEATTSTKKKKKAKDNDPFGGGEVTDPTAPAAVAEEPAKKKGKAKEADAAATEPGADAPADAPTEAPSKKKKKGKDDDPFGGGEVTDPTAAPAEEPVKKVKTKEKPADTPAPATPAPAPAAKTPDPATTEPAADPAADKKEAEKAAKEAEKAAAAAKKEEERLKKEEEKRKKDEEKKKKSSEDDPFGGS